MRPQTNEHSLTYRDRKKEEEREKERAPAILILDEYKSQRMVDKIVEKY